VYNDAVSPWLPAWRLGNPEKKADAVDIPEPFAKEMVHDRNSTSRRTPSSACTVMVTIYGFLKKVKGHASLQHNTLQDGEKVIHKPTFDGFLNTELEDYLKQSGKKQVT
jgi:hypothetical protein